MAAPDPAGNHLLRRLAGFRLNAREDPVDLRGSAEAAALRRIRIERLTGLALAGWERAWVRLSDRGVDELVRLHRDAMLHSLALERELVRVAGAFRDTGLDPVVLKGPVLARRYPNPSWRPFGDLDLLVGTEGWGDACAALRDLGYRRLRPEPRPGFDVRFGKAATHRGPTGLEVDLHRTLVVGPYGLWMQPEVLVERAVPFALGGVPLRRLDDTALVLHACVHASLGWDPPLLLTLRDIVEAASTGEPDWDELAVLTGRWRLRPVVASALEAAEEAFGPALPSEARTLRGYQPSARDRRILRSYRGARVRGGAEVATLRAIRGVARKGAYLRAMLFPSREFLAARRREGGQGTYPGRLSVPFRWLRSAVGARRG